MLSDLVQAGVICLTIGGLSYLGALGITHLIEQGVVKGDAADRLDARFSALNALSRKFQDRRTKLLPRMAKLDAELKSARRRNYMVVKRLADIEDTRDTLVRVLGEEDAFLRAERVPRKFMAAVINRLVQRAVLEQKEVPGLSKAWSRTQYVYAWALTIGDAKALIESYYPSSNGFHIVEIREPDEDGLAGFGDMDGALEQA
ncbi:MAG TPA: hypothetical protein VED40_10010 [Azospirillaceae bacterium]|nr:hypothetical protein [Azospirillaceae bacterium]